MMMKNAAKILLRTPLRTILFTLLILFCCLFMTSGISLYISAVQNIAAAKGSFRTIGTIEQKSDATGILEFWTPYEMRMVKLGYPTYTHIVDHNALTGLPCIQPPEKRELYLAYVPQLNPAIYDKPIGKPKENQDIHQLIFEFIPRETFDITQPHFVDITHYYYGNFDTGKMARFTDMLIYAETPELLTGEQVLYLEKGKRYVGSFTLLDCTQEQYETYGTHRHCVLKEGIGGLVYPDMMSYSGPMPAIAEVTEDFANSAAGRAFEVEAAYMARADNTIPVQPVQDHNLLLPFFNKTAKITEGREITPEEYQNKAMVCMIPADLANFAQLSPGDYLDLSLYEVNRQDPASNVFEPSGAFHHFCTLTEDGNLPGFFDTPQYQIVGIYSYMEKTSEPSGYELANNMVVVPSGTVNTENAVVPVVGPMLGSTTSFEIENGTSGQFLTAFSKLGLDDLEVRFYDGGYTIVMKGLTATKRTALILTIIGTICCFGVLLLYVFLQISRKRLEAGIERSLGYTKRQALFSLYLATLPVAITGAALGCVAGSALSSKLHAFILSLSGQTLFDPLFSSQVNAADRIMEFSMGRAQILLPNLISILFILVAAILLTYLFGYHILRSTPMQMLTARES